MNISAVENILDMSITDITISEQLMYYSIYVHNIILTLKMFLKKHHRVIGYIGPGKELLTTLLEFFFKDNTVTVLSLKKNSKIVVMRMQAILHDSFGMFYRKTKLSNGYYYRSTQVYTV